MKEIIVLALIAGLATCSSLGAQTENGSAAGSFKRGSASLQERLEKSLTDLSKLREQIAEQRIPLDRKVNDLEAGMIEARREYRETSRQLDSRTLDLSNLRTEIKARKEELSYLSNLLGEYSRNFASRLHIAEMPRYRAMMQAADLAPDNGNLSDRQVYEAQIALLKGSLDRLSEALGGSSFEGEAVDSSGMVNHGRFVLVGPAAFFRSADGRHVGPVEERVGSMEPTVVDLVDPKNVVATAEVVTTGSGRLPLDPTLGNARRVEATRESLWEQVERGGPVMVPILSLAGLALLVALYKWLALALVRKPSRRNIEAMLRAVGRHDQKTLEREVASIKGPVGKMLAAGVAHLREPRELIEEVMYETVLITRLEVQRFLPFIAIGAATAPLLGLLGTVTGIINTFKMITVFGSGDVKMLSGGISEALITTEFGLLVAIPSLLLHAILTRKARGVVGQMERTAVAFANEVSKSDYDSIHTDMADHDLPTGQVAVPELVRLQVNEVMRGLVAPMAMQNADDKAGRRQKAPDKIERSDVTAGRLDVEGGRSDQPRSMLPVSPPVGRE